ncbi:hypothetical protein ATO10_11837 [Actibacterium atlanticum]|uniref:Uncharacterized protein n=1 Tax=Actibacterium atlanticum TaxID=1461693 RepID=A0A058ZK90_9RHOB|nr:hypothetical protein [Actibacterium atlanticum]KCV81602.1 hypothetical protein ATO10_11837 [Actibacterium atlanticum]
MVDTRYCTAGRDVSGNWYIACKEQGLSSLEILTELGFTLSLSMPIDQSYHHAAKHIRKHGGLYWRTNAEGEYGTIAGIPKQKG